MPFLLFVLHFISTFWLILLLLGFWAGVRRRGTRKTGGWREHLMTGVIWALGVWLLAALDFGLLFLLGENGGVIPRQVNTGLFLGVGVLLGGLGGFRLAARLSLRRRLKDSSEALAWLQDLAPEDFEAQVGRYFKSLGYIVRSVGQSGDHGVDLAVYTPGEGKWIVQCKRYSRRSVGESAVRDLYGAMMHEHADRGFIFTTSTFSVHAQVWAEGKPIELVDGEELVARLHEQRVAYQSKIGMQAES
jgi:restriction system protein